MGVESLRKRYGLVLRYVGPTLLLVLVFSILPILYNTYLSFTNRNNFRFMSCPEGVYQPSGQCPSKGYVWVWFEQYRKLISDILKPEVLTSLLLFVLLIGLIYVVYRISSRLIERRTEWPGRLPGLLIALVLGAATWQFWPMIVSAAQNGIQQGSSSALVRLLAQLPTLQSAFSKIQASGDFFVVMARTTIWTVACVSLFFLVGLVLALILNSDLVRLRGFWRTMVIVPWAVPYYISALIWRFFFNGQFGTINNILRLLGWQDPPVWLNDPILAFGAVVIINVWMSFPFFTTIILGALQSIPKDMYEAARVDGANGWQQLQSVTLPLIRPALVPATVLSALTTFKIFESVWMVTRGGPFTAARTGSTEIVMLYAYNQAFVRFNFGYISAFAVVLFILLFAATIWQVRMTRLLSEGVRS